MSRDFDGVGDQLTFGSDASIDAFALKTIAFFFEYDSTGTNQLMLSKLTGADGWLVFTGTDDSILFAHLWTSTPGQYWGAGAGTLTSAVRMQIVISYDNGSVANDPVIWINNVSQIVVEQAGPPAGTVTSDAASTLQAGLGAPAGIADFNGRLQNLCIDNRIWSAADVNRHFWYGQAGGGAEIIHPMLTTKTDNEGIATANMTVAVGTTMVNVVRTERRYCASIGCGR